MELSEYAGVLRRRWRWILLPIALGLAAAVALIAVSTPKYASSARLFVSTSTQSSDLIQANQGNSLAIERVQSYVDLVDTYSLGEQVARHVDAGYSVTHLMQNVSARVVPNTVNLSITATDKSPEMAQKIAQAYAEALSQEVTRIEAPGDGKPSPIRMSVVDNAQVPTSPITPRKALDLTLGLFAGLMVGLCLALLRDRVDTSISSSDALAEVSDVPLLATLHSDPAAARKPPAQALKGSTPWAEAFRVLRTNLQFINVDRRNSVFVISSSVPAEGKTTVAVNLAVTLSLSGQRVVLVECDLRRPLVAERLGLDDSVGTTAVLVGQVSLQEALQDVPGTGLTVLTSGRRPPNPSELLQSRAMDDLIQQLRQQFDVVLLDSPPLIPVTDAALLAARSDGLIMTVRHGKTHREQLRLALQRIDAVEADCVGMVMNMAPTSGRGYGYAGYGGYGYEPPQGRHGRKKSEEKRAAASGRPARMQLDGVRRSRRADGAVSETRPEGYADTPTDRRRG